MKSTNIICLLLFAIIISINAAPLKNVRQTLKQPDGTIINCYASGDEFYHWLHDKEGFTITFNNETKY